MPLFFAAHADVIPNYKKMAEMDDQGRTAFALEHKFRAWRHQGRAILEAKDTESPGTAAPKKAAALPKATLKMTPTSAKGPKPENTRVDEDDDSDAASKQLTSEVCPYIPP